MAYAFDRIMGVLGRGKQDDTQAPGNDAQRSASPMAATSNPLGAQQGQQAPGQAPTDRLRASSSEGALPQAGGTGGQPRQQAPQAQQTPASRGRLFQANANRASSPVDLSAMGQQIESAKGRIKQTADDYVKNAGKYYSSQLPDYMKNSIQGYAGLTGESDLGMVPASGFGDEPGPKPEGIDPEAIASLNNPVPYSSWTDAYTQGPGQVAKFANPYQANITNADLISSDAGLGELFRRQGGAEYSGGDAAFDTALLRKNAAFNTLRDQTLAQNRDLQKFDLDIGDAATKQAQQALNAGYGGWKNTVTGELEAAAKALQARGGERESAFDTALTGKRDEAKAQAAEEAKKTIAQLSQDNPEMAFQIEEAMREGYDPTQFMNVSGPTSEATSWQDFLAGNEAKGFNNVMTLLGKGGPALSGGQYSGGYAPDFVKPSFDSASFGNFVLDKASKTPGLMTGEGTVTVPAKTGKNPGPYPGVPGGPGDDTSSPPWIQPTKPWQPWTPYTPDDIPTTGYEPLRPLPGAGPTIDVVNKANAEVNKKEDKAKGYVEDRWPKYKKPGGKLY